MNVHSENLIESPAVGAHSESNLVYKLAMQIVRHCMELFSDVRSNLNSQHIYNSGMVPVIHGCYDVVG